jgi:hypothetical protein
MSPSIVIEIVPQFFDKYQAHEKGKVMYSYHNSSKLIRKPWPLRSYYIVNMSRGYYPEARLLNKSSSLGAQQSVTTFITITAMALVTPKAAAKHELFFNKPASVFFSRDTWRSTRNNKSKIYEKISPIGGEQQFSFKDLKNSNGRGQ